MAAAVAIDTGNRITIRVVAALAVLLGFVAILAPFVAGIAVTLVLAAYLCAAGVLQMIAAFKAPGWGGRAALFALGLVCLVGGVLIFAHPVIGLLTVTLFCIASIFVAGIVRIVLAFRILAGGARWALVLSGLLSVLIAIMLYASFPLSAAWAFGVLVGISLIMEGISAWMFAGHLG
jgi:uncharacterized membrane protein HdeD (DUF308 family)